MTKKTVVDLFIIGGGINGVGIARDAVGRGLSVTLAEKDDLAQGTSSRSGKLIHGGLRYLEYYEFRLVKEALIEREILLNSACHIIWPMRFVLPSAPSNRPAWFVRLGLFLYDHLGGRKKLPGTRTLDLAKDPEGEPIMDTYKKAFEYSDCWVDDARLVILNAIGARDKGATILTQHECIRAKAENGVWTVQVKDKKTNKPKTIHAKCLVNAGGPWVNRIIENVTQSHSKMKIRMVKGSHLVTKKFWRGEQSYLIQNDDKRVIFINAYEGDKALIGTTDTPYDGKPESVTADREEIDYLINSVNAVFKEKLRHSDIIETFSGIRPLFDDDKDDPASVTRDYLFDLDETSGAPLLNIFGGKITTFRKLSEHALDKLTPIFPQMGAPWTKGAVLAGGDIKGADFAAFMDTLKAQYPQMPRDVLHHYGRLYGSRIGYIMGKAKSPKDLGKFFGGNLYEAEVRYLVKEEWATTPSDILERRTKEGLKLTPTQQQDFATWFSKNYSKLS